MADPRRKRFSPLTLRILAVNIFALAILVAGLLYVGEYRRSLLAAELESLRTRAEMFAAALGEGAILESRKTRVEVSKNPFFPGRTIVETRTTIAAPTARQMMRRLAAATEARARLFDLDGRLLVDSRTLPGPGGLVQMEMLPPPRTRGEGLLGKLLETYDSVVEALLGHGDWPPYIENPIQQAQDYEEVLDAIDGEGAGAVRKGRSGHPILSVAVPVAHYKHVLGAVMLTREAREIAEALFQVRLDILKMFAVALSITVLLSIYLARTIARPVRILAIAADRVRQGRHREYSIPVFPNRKDEIGVLSESLKEMTESLWQRMDATERFAADVAHEIKNPLTSLRSAVETAARVQDMDAQQKLMGIIQEDVGRLNRLISDISDASRLDSEMSRAEVEPVDLAMMLEILVDLQSTTGSAGQVAFRLTKDNEASFMIDGVGDRLMQVLRNVIGNALTFSPDGGMIALALVKHDGNARITIEDDGPGIPDGKEDAIFERFYSERPKSEKFGTHSGLGLSISRQIIKAHDGALTAENRRDPMGNVKGARFVIVLPLVG